ncbi:MAG TPA: tetratricopeptide repeat protein, partial [Pyrinomonadaceae bacterium]|nr:tetratricopeptide repeat protein [Pyrinomonadaceae bacterium]
MSIDETATEAGWKAFNENRYKDAAALLEKVTLLYPDSAIAHFRLAFSYRLLNRHDEALAHFNLAAQINPDDSGYRYQIGKQKAMRGDFIGALTHFADSLERDTMHIVAYYDAGACTARLGYLELSVQMYTTCGVLLGIAKCIGFRHDVSESQY